MLNGSHAGSFEPLEGAMRLLLPSVTAFLLTVGLVPIVRRLAHDRGLYAWPSINRWHRYPVPKVGGIAMFLPLVVAMAVAGVLPAFAPVVIGAGLMFGLGLVDDVKTLGPGTKLVFQMLAAAVLLLLLPHVRITGEPTLDRLLGFAWIVGITNAVNLLDNIDGLAAGVSCIVGICFVGVLVVDGSMPSDSPMAMGMGAFVGVTAGFLVYNFEPASIFMGDGGSHFLGSFLAGATLMAPSRTGPDVAPAAAIPFVLLLIPIFDTAFVTVARRLSGRSAFLGGRDHTSHRLVALGIGERRAVLVLYVLTLVGGTIAIGLVTLRPAIAYGLVALYAALLGVIGLYLGHVDVARDRLPEPAPLPSEIATRYRVYEVLIDAVLVGGAYYLAFVSRFHDPLFRIFFPYFARSVPIVVGLQVATLWLSGKYRQVWGTLGPTDTLRMIRSTVLGVGASVIAVLYIESFQGYSRGVFVFDAVLAPMFIVSARVALGAADQYLRLRQTRAEKALVYGAGRGGALAVREILQNAALDLSPIGYIDDDPHKGRLRLEGLPVVGTLGQLGAILDRHQGLVTTVVVSIACLPPARLEELGRICTARGVLVRRLRTGLEAITGADTAEPAGVVRFPGAH